MPLVSPVPAVAKLRPSSWKSGAVRSAAKVVNYRGVLVVRFDKARWWCNTTVVWNEHEYPLGGHISQLSDTLHALALVGVIKMVEARAHMKAHLAAEVARRSQYDAEAVRSICRHRGAEFVRRAMSRR